MDEICAEGDLSTLGIFFFTKIQMGKTVGVVGLGRIGREVASWCMNFGMNAIGYDPILTDSAARAAGIEPVSLDQVGGLHHFLFPC